MYYLNMISIVMKENNICANSSFLIFFICRINLDLKKQHLTYLLSIDMSPGF